MGDDNSNTYTAMMVFILMIMFIVYASFEGCEPDKRGNEHKEIQEQLEKMEDRIKIHIDKKIEALEQEKKE